MPPEPAGGNLAALGLIQAFRMAASTGVSVLVMRLAGVEGFGIYGYVSILVGLLSFATSMGLDRLLKRELARAPERGPALVSTGVVSVALLSMGSVVAVVGWVWLVDGREVVVVSASLAALAVALQGVATVPSSYFHAIRQMWHGVLPSLAGRVVFVVVAAALLAGGLDVRGVFFASALDGAVTLGGVAVAYRRLGQRWAATSVAATRALLRESIPFGLNGLFGNIYLNADVLLLAWMRDDTEVGIYRAAVMLVALFPLVAETFTQGLYPRMARHLGNREAATGELRFAARVLLAVSLPAAVGALLTAAPLMVFLGGEEFAASALPFMLMAPLLPLRFLNNGYAMTLSALDRQGDRTRGVSLAAAFNVLVNILVIPRWGAVGCAAVTLATEILLWGWFRWRSAGLVGDIGLKTILIRVASACAGMAVVVEFVPQVHVVLTILAGVVAYCSLAFATGALRRDDLRQLRRV